MARRYHRAFLTSVLAGFVFVGVAIAQKVEIKTNQAPNTDFKVFRTYAWLPPVPVVKDVAPDAVTNPTLSEEVLMPALVAAVDRELAARGFTKAAAASADVHVAYFAALSVGFNQSYLGEHYGYITGWASPIPIGLAPTTNVTVYEKGTVLVDIVDRAANKAVWRGTALTRIAQEHSVEKRIERINEAAKKMFEKYPVKPGKKPGA
ncbi:MAG TPA: DUF4136 domain-containing protein [Vicinamibacterales bacterium]|nr:DUF4136 domain-containing protein [Vicinamibacterales bacterium]